MRILSLFVLVLITSLLSCEKEQEGQAGEGVQIRVENTSQFTYQEILVKIDEEHHYGTLKPGDKSAYQTFTKAYRYAYVRLKIGDKTYVLQPIDYGGEKELKEGKYTYQVVAHDGAPSGHLALTLKED